MFFVLKKIALRLASPNILFWTLPAMMCLVIAGTLAQKTIGSFAAQKEYFSSFWVMIAGIIPFPGGATLLLVFFANLLAKFLLRSEWSFVKAGTNLSHFGVILLVLGGLVTAVSSREGYLLIPEGEKRQEVEDYHEKQLVLRKDKDTRPVLVVPARDLSVGKTFLVPDTNTHLTILGYCENCDVLLTKASEARLIPRQTDHQEEKNRTGVSFRLSGPSLEKPKNYVTFDHAPRPVVVKTDDEAFQVALERKRQEIPFSIELKKFEQTFHPGTDMARGYTSHVVVHDAAESWPVTISMNQPLRHRGYTFYQSSFDLDGRTPATVLTVVRNRGWIFPYLASFLIALGLLFHIFVRLRESGR